MADDEWKKAQEEKDRWYKAVDDAIADNHSEALRLITAITRYEDAGSAVGRSFRITTSPEVRSAAIERLIALRPTDPKGHGYWVHSLSNCDELMWEAKDFESLKRLYQLAFEGGMALATRHCLDRLVTRLIGSQYSKPMMPTDLDPTDFGLTPEICEWISKKDDW